MGRRIFTGARRGQTLPQSAVPPTTDNYLDRLVKYIPAEIVGLYLTVAGVIPLTDGRPDATALWVVFALCFVITPIYMYIVTKREGNKRPLWLQVVLAGIAFPVWVFALGGPFATLAWYRSWYASITLAVVTFAFGAIAPSPGD